MTDQHKSEPSAGTNSIPPHLVEAMDNAGAFDPSEVVVPLAAAISAYASPSAQTIAEEGEPVAVIGKNWSLLWAQQGSLTKLVERTGIGIGSKLYTRPSPAPDKTAPVGEVEEAIAALKPFARVAEGIADYDDAEWIDGEDAPLQAGDFRRAQNALTALSTPPTPEAEVEAVGEVAWAKNAAGVKDGAACYRTINGARWEWFAEDADQVRSAGAFRCRKAPGGGCFVHPDDADRAIAALSSAPAPEAETVASPAGEGGALYRIKYALDHCAQVLQDLEKAAPGHWWSWVIEYALEASKEIDALASPARNMVASEDQVEVVIEEKLREIHRPDTAKANAREIAQAIAALQASPATPDAVAALREAARKAHDTLIELNPNNYSHDDVCQANDAAIEAILILADVLGETHGKTPEWWAERHPTLSALNAGEGDRG